jgi:ubiquinone/menaquinone biosynthesis C-methylase UbiE
MKDTEIKKAVREGYGKIAREGGTCCNGGSSSCCGTSPSALDIGQGIGYSVEELGSVPDGANLGLGCGNPTALASLREGETVLDLGSGAGFDCFLAARKVGDRGKVIGVDMTPEMINRARENARQGGYKNTEFRPGEIEHLPVADNSVDAVISNCVINLSTDKKRVFREVYRVLKPGGRIMVSDLVLLKPLPDFVLESLQAYVSCVAGASLKADYLKDIEEAGFKDVEVLAESVFPAEFIISDPTVKAVVDGLGVSPDEAAGLAASVASTRILAWKL